MSQSPEKEACLAYFNELINQDGFDAGAEILSDQVTFNYPIGVLEGREAVLAYLREFKSAFPDAHFTVHDLIGEGEQVAARWTMNGTQSGEFKGRAPTGRRIELPGLTHFRLKSGRIVEMWIAFNPNILLG